MIYGEDAFVYAIDYGNLHLFMIEFRLGRFDSKEGKFRWRL